MSLLKSVTRANPIMENVAAAVGWNFGDVAAHADASNSSNVSNDGATDGISCGSASNSVTLAALTPAAVSSPTQPFAYALPGHVEPSPEEAEVYLRIFRTQKLKYLPFMYIPESTSSQQLLRERPFLWLCIMSISCKSVSQKLGIGREIRQIASREILVDGERNMVLLLGLLVFIGRYVLNSKKRKISVC